jgi:hypothetical protein
MARAPLHRSGAALGAVALVVAVAAGCSDADTDTGDAFCDARNSMSNALGNLVDPSDSTSVGEAADEVGESLDDLADVTGDDLDDEMDRLGRAVASLDDAVTASDGQSTTERLDTLGDSVAEVGSALDAVVSAAARDC